MTSGCEEPTKIEGGTMTDSTDKASENSVCVYLDNASRPSSDLGNTVAFQDSPPSSQLNSITHAATGTVHSTGGSMRKRVNINSTGDSRHKTVNTNPSVTLSGCSDFSLTEKCGQQKRKAADMVETVHGSSSLQKRSKTAESVAENKKASVSKIFSDVPYRECSRSPCCPQEKTVCCQKQFTGQFGITLPASLSFSCCPPPLLNKFHNIFAFHDNDNDVSHITKGDNCPVADCGCRTCVVHPLQKTAAVAFGCEKTLENINPLAHAITGAVNSTGGCMHKGVMDVFVKRRVSANARERRRMQSMNVAFDRLRGVIPTFGGNRKLSKYETLQMAQSYIAALEDILRR